MSDIIVILCFIYLPGLVNLVGRPLHVDFSRRAQNKSGAGAIFRGQTGITDRQTDRQTDRRTDRQNIAIR